MAKIVYTDRDRSAPYVSFHGVDFTHGQEVEVEDHRAELLEMAAANPFFEVRHDGDPRQEAAGDPPRRSAKGRFLPGRRK